MAKVIGLDGSLRQRLTEVSSGGGDGRIKVAFNWGDATPKNIYLATAGTTIFTASILLQVGLNGVNPSLRLGDAGNLSRLLSTAQVDAGVAAEYESNPGYTYLSDTQIILSIAPGIGCSQGSGFVILEI